MARRNLSPADAATRVKIKCKLAQAGVTLPDDLLDVLTHTVTSAHLEAALDDARFVVKLAARVTKGIANGRALRDGVHFNGGHR